MKYRRLDDNWDYVFGHGKYAYVSGAEAVRRPSRRVFFAFVLRVVGRSGGRIASLGAHYRESRWSRQLEGN